MTTRATLVSQVEGIIDRTDVTARINTAFNTIMNRIARKYDFAVLFDEDTSLTTVAGTFTYTLPSATNRIYRLIYEDSNNSLDLTEIPFGEFDRKFPYPSSLGNTEPSVYCRRNETTIDMAHPPAAAKTLRLFRSKFPTEFTGDASEPEYIRMDDVLVAGVVSEIYHQLGVTDDADTWKKVFDMELKDAYEKDQFAPHKMFTPQYFGGGAPIMSNYWKNPFYRG